MSPSLQINPPIPGIIGIDHVGIAVADLDEAIKFYQERFGATLTHREENQEMAVAEAMIKIGDSTIQLLAPLTESSAIARFLQKRGPGMQQLAYRVESIDAAMAAVRALGMELLYENSKRGTKGSKINFIHPKDAGGVLVELVEIV